MNGILTKLYPKNGSKWIFPQILLPSLQTIPKAGASACEKGGRWLLSLELLREAKVWHVWSGGFSEGFWMHHIQNIKKNWWLYTYIIVTLGSK